MKQYTSHSEAWVDYEREDLKEGESFQVGKDEHKIVERGDGSAYMKEVLNESRAVMEDAKYEEETN